MTNAGGGIRILLPGQDYFWRATAYNAAGYTEGSPQPFLMQIAADAPEIPAVSAWGLAVMGLLVSIAAAIVIRRGSRASFDTSGVK